MAVINAIKGTNTLEMANNVSVSDLNGTLAQEKRAGDINFIQAGDVILMASVPQRCIVHGLKIRVGKPFASDTTADVGIWNAEAQTLDVIAPAVPIGEDVNGVNRFMVVVPMPLDDMVDGLGVPLTTGAGQIDTSAAGITIALRINGTANSAGKLKVMAEYNYIVGNQSGGYTR